MATRVLSSGISGQGVFEYLDAKGIEAKPVGLELMVDGVVPLGEATPYPLSSYLPPMLFHLILSCFPPCAVCHSPATLPSLLPQARVVQHGARDPPLPDLHAIQSNHGVHWRQGQGIRVSSDPRERSFGAALGTAVSFKVKLLLFAWDAFE